MEFYFGLIAAGLIGVCLGLIGSGGSILTVPLLVYCFNIDATDATSYASFIVGVTAAIGAVISITRKEVDVKTAILFSIPCFLSVYITRRYLFSLIPDPVFTNISFVLSKDAFIMTLLLFFMIIAGVSMIVNARSSKKNINDQNARMDLIVISGLIVGPVTALIGMGGGFLIVPSLVIFGKLPMKKAVGTSLTIIASKSFFSVMGDFHAGQNFNFDIILLITGLAVAGMLIGAVVREHIEIAKLKYSFGYFVVALALVILCTEVVSRSKVHEISPSGVERKKLKAES